MMKGFCKINNLGMPQCAYSSECFDCRPQVRLGWNWVSALEHVLLEETSQNFVGSNLLLLHSTCMSWHSRKDPSRDLPVNYYIFARYPPQVKWPDVTHNFLTQKRPLGP